MPNIILYSDVTDVKTGDIYVTKSTIPLINHYAIAFFRDGKPYITDRGFIDDKVNVMALEDYLRISKVKGIIRDSNTLKTTDTFIESKIADHSILEYNVATNNCEDYVKDLCQYNFLHDQRAVVAMVFLGLILIVVFKNYTINV